MRKLWSYGNRPKPYTQNNRRDLRHIKKTKRNRERATTSLLAGGRKDADHGEKSKE